MLNYLALAFTTIADQKTIDSMSSQVDNAFKKLSTQAASLEKLVTIMPKVNVMSTNVHKLRKSIASLKLNVKAIASQSGSNHAIISHV